MKIIITDIEWDTSGLAGSILGDLDFLPSEVPLDLSELGLEDVTEENSSQIAEWLSDKYVACVDSFQYTRLKTVSVQEDVVVKYEVEIPEGLDEEQEEEAICANQPPRSEWGEAVNERSWEDA